MYIGVIGSREFSKVWIPEIKKFVYPGQMLVQWIIIQIAGRFPDATIVSGGANGVDTWAIEAARAIGMSTLELKAEWDRYGISAGYRRNQQLVDTCDMIVAFLDESSKGGSKGTKHTIELARTSGKLRSIYEPSGTFESFPIKLKGR